MSPSIICPACNGSLTYKVTGTRCHFCDGKRTMTPQQALQYAAMLERQAMDGMVSGLMGKDEAEGMYREADQIRRGLGQ